MTPVLRWLLVLALLVATGCSRQDPPPLDLSSDTSHAQMLDVVEIMRQTGRHDSLLHALDVAGMSGDVQHGGPFTVFAPTDQAFRRRGIPLDTLDGLDTLRLRLSLHLARGRYDTSNVTDSLRIGSMADHPITLYRDSQGLQVEDHRVQRSYPGGNGIVHVIDSRLELPTPDTTNNLVADTAGTQQDEP